MKLVFDERAASDLDSMFLWLVQDSLTAADALIERLCNSAELPTTFPLMGHSGRIAGAFEWVVPRLPYVLIYQIDRARDEVIVSAIFHTAQELDGQT